MFEVFLRYIHPSRWHRVGIVTYRFSIFFLRLQAVKSVLVRISATNLQLSSHCSKCRLAFCAFLCCVCHTSWIGEFLFSPIKVLCPKKWRVVLMKTTACFDENNVSFYGKWRLVFNARWEAQKNYGRNGTQKLSLWKSENTYNHPFLRVRVRACYRNFCVFAVTSVTGFEIRCWNSVSYCIVVNGF